MAYDVSDDDARAHLAALLGNSGVRIQKSVFECELEPHALDLLLCQAQQLLDPRHDLLRAFRQCHACAGSQRHIGAVSTVVHDLWWVV